MPDDSQSFSLPRCHVATLPCCHVATLSTCISLLIQQLHILSAGMMACPPVVSSWHSASAIRIITLSTLSSHLVKRFNLTALASCSCNRTPAGDAFSLRTATLPPFALALRCCHPRLNSSVAFLRHARFLGLCPVLGSQRRHDLNLNDYTAQGKLAAPSSLLQ